jgi:hypothetical protein
MSMRPWPYTSVMLCVTPAMEGGIADHVWSIEEIVALSGWNGAVYDTDPDDLVRMGHCDGSWHSPQSHFVDYPPCDCVLVSH